MLSESEYITLKEKYAFYHSERERLFPGKNCFTQDMQACLPESCTNDEISAIEVYEFMTNPPDKYFLYISSSPGVQDKGHKIIHLSGRKATTWTGDVLGYVYCGSGFYSNFGDYRIPISIKAINGYWYHGTFFYSAGDYARVKKGKAWGEN